MTRGGHRQAEGGGGGRGRTARARAEAGQHGGEGDGGAEDNGDQEAVRLGLGPKLDSMAEKETVAPKTMATEKMVPFTMGTLDTKSIGLTSATIRPRAYCAKGGPKC